VFIARPSFQWRDLVTGKILDNKTPALRGKHESLANEGYGLPFE